ncbi:hypothetical protein CEP53_013353 [Fusarium sp. AF-6]|nr:hypothetical protein CEP53_013353 [Fusarium sp. AF-6]
MKTLVLYCPCGTMCVGVNIPTRYPAKSPYRNTPSISTTRGFIPDLKFLPWNMILAKVMTLSPRPLHCWAANPEPRLG